MSKSNLTLETPMCDFCGSSEVSSLGYFSDKLYRREGRWEIVHCESCGHERIEPMLDSEFLSTLYDAGEYYSFRTGRLRKIVKFLRKRTRRLLPKNLTDCNFLDFGCGDGEVLQIAKGNGASVYGLEVGATADILKEITGLDIRNSEAPEWGRSMDYVRSFHSLEHVSDPRQVVRMLAQLLKPNTGELWIGVPNAGSVVAKLFGKYWFYRGVPYHTHGFTPESISLLAQSEGLDVVSLRTPGSFRGLLGSIAIFLQSLLSDETTEPGMVSFVVLSPIFILALPFVLAANAMKKGDVLEIKLGNVNDQTNQKI